MAPRGVGDLVCPNCSSGESSSLCVGAGCSARGEMWVWAIFKCSPTPPRSSSSCHLHVSWFSLVSHCTSLSPTPEWGSQRVVTGWSRLRAEWRNSLGRCETLELPLGSSFDTQKQISARKRNEAWSKLLLLFLGTLGSDLVTHTCCTSPAQPTPVLVPLTIPLPVRPQLSKGRCQEQPPKGFSVGY